MDYYLNESGDDENYYVYADDYLSLLLSEEVDLVRSQRAYLKCLDLATLSLFLSQAFS